MLNSYIGGGGGFCLGLNWVMVTAVINLPDLFPFSHAINDLRLTTEYWRLISSDFAKLMPLVFAGIYYWSYSQIEKGKLTFSQVAIGTIAGLILYLIALIFYLRHTSSAWRYEPALIGAYIGWFGSGLFQVASLVLASDLHNSKFCPLSLASLRILGKKIIVVTIGVFGGFISTFVIRFIVSLISASYDGFCGAVEIPFSKGFEVNNWYSPAIDFGEWGHWLYIIVGLILGYEFAQDRLHPKDIVVGTGVGLLIYLMIYGPYTKLVLMTAHNYDSMITRSYAEYIAAPIIICMAIKAVAALTNKRSKHAVADTENRETREA